MKLHERYELRNEQTRQLEELQHEIEGVMCLCNESEELTTNNLGRLEELTQNYLDILQRAVINNILIKTTTKINKGVTK